MKQSLGLILLNIKQLNSQGKCYTTSQGQKPPNIFQTCKFHDFIKYWVHNYNNKMSTLQSIVYKWLIYNLLIINTSDHSFYFYMLHSSKSSVNFPAGKNWWKLKEITVTKPKMYNVGFSKFALSYWRFIGSVISCFTVELEIRSWSVKDSWHVIASFT